MSWIKENYHIAALGGGVLVLAGLGYTSYASAQETKAAFEGTTGRGGKDITVAGGPLLKTLTKSLSEEDPLTYQSTAVGRPVNLFTSVELFTKEGDTGQLLDLLQMEGKVHDPIPNKWWVDNIIDPSWSDSPSRDQDGDGFTNLEEFEDKTDPNKADSHGDLIKKLKVADVKSDVWLLEFNSVLGQGFQFNYKFRAEGGPLEENRMGANDAIQKGDLFFKDNAGKDRFKLMDIEPRKMKTSIGETDVNFAIIEDQVENKKGQIYELQFGMRQKELLETTKFDHTVVFYLDAIGEAGNKFEVVENGMFALPSSGAEKIYKLAEVEIDPKNKNEPVSVTVEWDVDGATQSRKIPVK